MKPVILRAEQLLEQRRYDLATAEARRGLAEDPENSYLTAILTLALDGEEKHAEALESARRTLELAPDWSRSHYLEGIVLNSLRKYKESIEALDRGLALDPHDADIHAARASSLFGLHHFRQALASAEAGLECEPEHIGCNNIRAATLMRLKRKEEAGVTIEAALARDPENAFTHLNAGWAALETGNRHVALSHFRECLRLDPSQDNARQGIIEALKSGFFLYRCLLGYLFWMQSLSPRTQWIVILGGLFGTRILRASLDNAGYPVAAGAILGLYLMIVAFMWTASPLLHLLLRLHPEGRLVLSDEERAGANIAGGLLGTALILAASGAILGLLPLLIGALSAFALIVPVTIGFNASAKSAKYLMWALSACLLITLLIGVGGTLLGKEGAVVLTTLPFIGAVLSTWLGNISAFRPG